MYHREQIIYTACVQEYKKESNKYVRRSLQIAVITMITIVFLGWDLSPIMDEKLMKGIPTVALLWKSAKPIQSCQEKICFVQIKIKKNNPQAQLSCSNWSSVLQRLLHGDKTKGFGG